jgi:uncharacterized protein (TIGR02996 family)
VTLPAHLLAEQAAFLAAIRAEPDSDTPRLVYADWLTERGEDLGEVSCSECEGTGKADPKRTLDVVGDRWRYDDGPCPRCRGTGTVGNGLAERATFIREQIAYYLFHGGHHTDATTPSGKGFGIESCSPFSPAVVGRDPAWLRFRLPDHRQIAWIVCERGWVRDVRCPWAWWVEHHAAILAHPDVCLRRVELTTWPDDGWWHRHVAALPGRGEYRVRALRIALRDTFPGHCRYDDDQGHERHHPIQWVLPGERFETLSACERCEGTGSADSGGTGPDGEPITIECPDCGGTGTTRHRD